MNLNESELRKQIQQIRQDESIPAGEKARRIQMLMAGRWMVQEEQVEPPSISTTLSEKDVELTYFNQGKGILGCGHYMRNCKLRAACCGKVFTCRFCHDEANERALEPSASSAQLTAVSGHKIDRYATKEVLCMLCKTIQPVSDRCANDACKQQFARYFCAVCKFYDDDAEKDIYHCEKCGLCRKGKGLGIDFQHCSICDACLSIVDFESHKCISNKLKGDCPICGTDMFTSTQPASILSCGHAIHRTCMKLLFANSYKCPICNKSADGIDWKRHDRVIQRTPMPEEYRNIVVTIHCNDCGKDCRTFFHVAGHKCRHCGSYNTAKDKMHAVFHSDGRIERTDNGEDIPPLPAAENDGLEDDDDDDDGEDDEEAVLEEGAEAEAEGDDEVEEAEQVQ